MGDDADATPMAALAVPERSKVDNLRALVEALLNLVPCGAGAAASDLIGALWSTALEKRTKEFHHQVAAQLGELAGRVDDLDHQLDHDRTLAALTEGTLAAARSASEAHLAYLAAATAHAVVDPRGDYALLLLRTVGDISASHIRLLQVLTEIDLPDNIGPLQLVVEEEAPELKEVASALYGDLERMGLVGDEVQFQQVRVVDGGGPSGPMNPVVTELGRAVLAFTSDL